MIRMNKIRFPVVINETLRTERIDAHWVISSIEDQ
jgi:hypothetical protein